MKKETLTKRIIREPLIHFLLIGAGLFLLYGWINPNNAEKDDAYILIDDSDIHRLISSYRQNWGKAPDSLTLKNLVDDEIRSEILYREALRMNLDHNDEIIRRRLKQKYEFLVKDLAEGSIPDSNSLKAFYEKHAERYISPSSLTFGQAYFSPDKRKNALQDAQDVFARINASTSLAKLGDQFHLQSFFADRNHDQVRQLFGKTFADSLFQISQENWLGIIPSGYGIHLVHISQISPASTLPYAKVQEDVRRDWTLAQQQNYNTQLYESLQEQYEVILDLDEWKGVVKP